MKEQSLFTPEEYKKNFKRNKKAPKERSLQLQVCDYLRNSYPGVIFMCDLASGMNLGAWIGGINSQMRSSRGQPDLFIAHPSDKVKNFGAWGLSGGGESNVSHNRFYSGLFIELKSDSAQNPILKDGSISTNEHVQEQWAVIQQLRNRGYKAEFAKGYEEAKAIIDEYLTKT